MVLAQIFSVEELMQIGESQSQSRFWADVTDLTENGVVYDVSEPVKIFLADFITHIVFIYHGSSSNKAHVSVWVCLLNVL